MLTKGMIMVVIGIGGLLITILLGIVQLINSKNKGKSLKTDTEKGSEPSNNIIKNLDSYNSIYDAGEEAFNELLNQKSTELLNKENESTEVLHNDKKST